MPHIGYFAYLRQQENVEGYDPRLQKTPITYDDVQQLVEDYAGTGLKLNHFETGLPGPREMVDFETSIGCTINRINGERITTNWGVIDYTKKGCHMIPAFSGHMKQLHILPIAYVALAAQAALLGRVIPQLRSICVDHIEEDDLIYIRFYYDGEITEIQRNDWECAISEIIADLGPHFNHDTKLERLDFPQKMPIRGRYVFSRKE